MVNDGKGVHLPIDLIDAAEAAGRARHRSTAQRLEHWARFGMYLDRQVRASQGRIQRAFAGDAALDDLDEDERIIANAEIDATISAAANSVSFADRLGARGVTFSVDDEGIGGPPPS